VANAEVYAVTAAGSWWTTQSRRRRHYTITWNTNTSYTVSFDVCFGIMVWEMGMPQRLLRDFALHRRRRRRPVTGVDFAIAPARS